MRPVLALALVLAASTQAFAQGVNAFDGKIVKEVKFEGISRTSE